MEYSERTNSQGHDRYDRHDSFPDLVRGHAMNATAWSRGVEANRSFSPSGWFMTGSWSPASWLPVGRLRPRRLL